MSSGDNMKTNITYIECACLDMEDLTRIYYDPEDKFFSFEYKLVRFPDADPRSEYNPEHIINMAKRQSIWARLRWKLINIKCYWKAIWWAVRGRPIWFTANPVYTKEEAAKMAEFIIDNLTNKD